MKELGRKIKFINSGVHLSVRLEVSVFFLHTRKYWQKISLARGTYSSKAKLFKVYVFLMAPFMHNWKDVCSNTSFPQNIWTG